MKKVIATWICIDDKADASYFPSAKGSSADNAVQNIYWRCICTFFWNARFHNPYAELVLLSNQNVFPVIDQTSTEEVLKNLGVKFYVTPFEFKTPIGYYGEWRNQFYEFSIFKYISQHKDFSEEDLFILLDSDCIITGDLNPVFDKIEQQKCITYEIDYKISHKINGNSRQEMKLIFEGLSGKEISGYPVYHGGEFYASTIGMMKIFMADFETVWKQLLLRNSLGLEKLNEEAHVLSYLFYLHNIHGATANQFVKRLWTDPAAYRNVVQEDINLLIWHLPAEKRNGFKKLFDWLQSIHFDLKAVNKNMLSQRIQKTFMVPNVPLGQRPYYAAKSIAKKLLSRS